MVVDDWNGERQEQERKFAGHPLLLGLKWFPTPWEGLLVVCARFVQAPQRPHPHAMSDWISIACAIPFWGIV